MYNFRTDMADERRDIYKKINKLNDVPGIETEERNDNENIKVTKVTVLDEKGAEAIGKPKGSYVTIDIKNLKIAGEDEIQVASESVTKELDELISKHIQKEDVILIVGLGNE